MVTPDWPTTIESIVTSTAIIVGGGWALWKWGYGERLRKHREQPDLDGTLTASSAPLSAGKAYLTLQAAWRNPGPLPIRMCPEHSFVEQYELTGDPPVGDFRLEAGPGVAKVSKVPLTWAAYTMGSQTTSVMSEHFVVATNSVYYFTWIICMGAFRKNKHHSWCGRDLIWALPQSLNAARPGFKNMVYSTLHRLSNHR